MSFVLRKATAADVPALSVLIEASVCGLQAADYTPSQIESALASVYGVDSQLIADGTYFVVETEAGLMVACGGWSQRKTLYGGDVWKGREDSLLDPRKDAAKIRAFFVHPAWVRRGIGSLLPDACEQAAFAADFRRLEMGATLSGVPLFLVGHMSAAGTCQNGYNCIVCSPSCHIVARTTEAFGYVSFDYVLGATVRHESLREYWLWVHV